MKLKLVIALVAGFLGCFDAQREALFQPVGRSIASLLYDRTFHISGNRELSSDFFTDRIPATISNVNLIVSGDKNLEQFKRHPLIQSIDMKRCNAFSIGCFSINVVERPARFVAAMDKSAQLLAKDGRLIATINKDLLGQHLGENGVTLPELQGLFPEGKTSIPLVMGLQQFSESPDTLQQSFRLAATILDSIENQGKSPVTILTFKNANLVDVRFSGLSPLVTLSVGDTSGENDSKQALDARINTQLVRLQAVRQAIGETINATEKIDVGFNKQAVVTLAKGFGFNQPPAKKGARS